MTTTDDDEPARERTRRQRRLSAYWSLVKPRIVALLCLTGTTAFVAAGGQGLLRGAAFVVAGACIAGGSAALNCVYDRDIDRTMRRTADRPLPSGRLPWPRAVVFAGLLFALGTALGLLVLPTVAVGHMWLGVAAYVGLYTVGLKRRHWLGVVLGGSAGSFPVLAGWTAVRPLTLTPVLFAVLVFAWTPAHAWALATVYRDDFAAASVPTLPVVTAHERIQRAVWVAALSTVAVTAAVAWVTPSPTAVVAVVACAALVTAARRFERTGTDAAAVRLFFTTNTFLAVLFLAWAASRVVAVGPVERVAAAGVAACAFVGTWSARPSLRGVPAAPGVERRFVDLTRAVADRTGLARPDRRDE